MSFDYTFDYLLMPIASVSQSEIERATNQPWSKLQRIFQNGGYAIAKRGAIRCNVNHGNQPVHNVANQL
jgi:hypothetical protein